MTGRTIGSLNTKRYQLQLFHRFTVLLKLEEPLLGELLNILFCRSKCLLFVLQGSCLTLHYNPNKEALICKIASDVSRCNKLG